MQKLFTRYISIVIIISSVIISIIAWQSLERIEIVSAENTMKQRLVQLCEKFDSSELLPAIEQGASGLSIICTS